MSLINQMLQDLERRSSGLPASTQFEPAKSKSLGTDQEKPKTHAFLKVTGTLILLYCAVFLWVKNPDLFKLFNKNTPSENVVAQTAPQATPMPQAQPAPATAPVVTEEKNIAQKPTQQHLAQQAAEPPATEQPVTPAKKLAVRPKPTPSEVLTASEEAMPMAAAVAPQNAEEAKHAEMVAAEFKKSKLRQSNGQTENGFRKIESAEQKSNNLFNRAMAAFDQGRMYEAQAYLSKSLQENPANEEARQTLAALLVDNKKMAEAQELLQGGIKQNPKQTGFRMAVARLQLEAGEKQHALGTLTEGLPYAEKNPEYLSFLATLLQRAERHQEAVTHFNTAIQLRGNYPNDFVGLGISLQALEKFEEAQTAYARAVATEKLTPELQAFVEQRLKQIGQRLAYQ